MLAVALMDFLIRFVPLLQVLIGAIVGALVALWAAQREETQQQFNLAASCLTMTERLVDRYAGQTVQIQDIDVRVNLLPMECQSRRRAILDAIRAVAVVQANDTSSAATPTDRPSTADSTMWVALGFLGPDATNVDVNFVGAGGAALSAAPPAGTVLRTKWQVNVRPGPADWSQVLRVLELGQCFQVQATRELAAGSRQQTWARGVPVPCPAQK